MGKRSSPAVYERSYAPTVVNSTHSRSFRVLRIHAFRVATVVFCMGKLCDSPHDQLIYRNPFVVRYIFPLLKYLLIQVPPIMSLLSFHDLYSYPVPHGLDVSDYRYSVSHIYYDGQPLSAAGLLPETAIPSLRGRGHRGSSSWSGIFAAVELWNNLGPGHRHMIHFNTLSREVKWVARGCSKCGENFCLV